MDLVNLRQTSMGWEFKSEMDLENFIWANLQHILDLIPFKRQYCINGQYCDILGLRENKQLVLLELKNNEDRYIIQQLTRYYHALKEEEVLADQINYKMPIEIIAITPNFHKDNFIDRIYNKLSIRFLEFSILLEENTYFFVLKDLDNQHIVKTKIFYDINNNDHGEIGLPPRALINRIAKCDKLSEEAQEAILRIRKKILTFDQRMKESVNGNAIEYGQGKHKKCAEFYFCTPGSLHYNGKPHLFLRLPDPHIWKKQTTKRMWIWVDENWERFTGMSYYIRAFISSKNEFSITYKYPDFVNQIKRYKVDNFLKDENNVYYQSYKKIIDSQTNSLDLLVDIALENWLKRL